MTDDETTSETTATLLQARLEALLLLTEDSLSVAELTQAVRDGSEEDETPVAEAEVEAALVDLAAFYDRTGRGFALRCLGGGWRYWTRSEHARVIERSVTAHQRATLSRAALETLAVVAYLQPVSRSRVAAVRGVSVDAVMRTLQTRDLVAEHGQDPTTGAMLFTTTEHFLERLGLDSLTQLPPLAPHLPEASELEDELRRLAETPPEQPDAPEPGAHQADLPGENDDDDREDPHD